MLSERVASMLILTYCISFRRYVQHNADKLQSGFISGFYLRWPQAEDKSYIT